MTPRTRDLLSTWRGIAVELGRNPGVSAVPSGVTTKAGPILIGLDHDMRRHVLVPLVDGEIVAEDRKGTALQIWGLERDGVKYASAVCVDRDSEDLFLRFAEDVLAHIGGATKGGKEFLNLVNRWRRLFGRGRDQLLGPEQLAGIFGELLQLKSLVALVGASALTHWAGPRGEPHDFTSVNADLEVKSTLRRNGRRVTINGISQLDQREDAALVLVHYGLERSPDGRSVPTLLDELEEAGILRLDLLELLSPNGYRAVDERNYSEVRFVVRERRAYDVLAPGFPRITPASFAGSDLPPGVVEMTYVIDLTNEPPNPLDDAEFHQIEALVVGQ